MTESKAREFWVREPKEPRKGAMTVATEIKEPWLDQAPQSGSHWLRKPAFKVIEKSFADKLQAELKAKDVLLRECEEYLEMIATNKKREFKYLNWTPVDISKEALQKLREGKK